MKRVALIFGGRSSEHEVSCVSAASVAENLDREKYEVILVGIEKSGRWLLADTIGSLRDGSWKNSDTEVILSPSTGRKLLLRKGDSWQEKEIDVAFPMLHGLWGEDGTIQGLFEMADIPYVGCGTLSSAVCMDKLFAKQVAAEAGIIQADFVPVFAEKLADMDSVIEGIEKKEAYPVFVKPSNAGSSVGITKAHDREELKKGLLEAAKHDRKILVEETIVGRELECAAYGWGEETLASGVGEVISAAEFYDYDAKYNDAASRTVIDPPLPEGKKEEIQEVTRKIFRCCDGFGFARVDFFLEKDTNRVVFSEINTIPGHTAISMYPMLMAASGYPMPKYLDGLIEMAFSRHKNGMTEK